MVGNPETILLSIFVLLAQKRKNNFFNLILAQLFLSHLIRVYNRFLKLMYLRYKVRTNTVKRLNFNSKYKHHESVVWSTLS